MDENPQCDCLLNYVLMILIERLNLDLNVLKRTEDNYIPDLIVSTPPYCIHRINVAHGTSLHFVISTFIFQKTLVCVHLL